VGAFWRNNQRGERVIRFDVGASNLNNHGYWIATVSDYEPLKWNYLPNNPSTSDGVVLAVGGSTAPGMYTASPSDPDASPGYFVSGNLQTITGYTASNGEIAFRIGCERTFAAYNALSNPARYAVVTLFYGANGSNVKMQKIYLRQGQGDDYVMRTTDPGTGLSGSPTRPLAAKFSPYNLTDLAGWTGGSIGNPTPAPQFYPPGGVQGVPGFTTYPSQAGYHLAFGAHQSGTVWAVSPHLTAVGGWNSSMTPNGYWNTVHETCPSGYRRPYDALPDGNAHTSPTLAGSEIRQSLWLNPPTGTNSNTDNSVWGYYADGYFDRRPIVNASGTGAVAISAVANTGPEAAYIGRLFYNPSTTNPTYASVFFPAPGFRYWQNGALHNAGGNGAYWTTTTYSGTNQNNTAWYLYFFSTTALTSAAMQFDHFVPVTTSSKTQGHVIRCVRIPNS
jgi:hypothetical protein